MLGTPTREQIREMNPNYTEFKFPQIKAHPWTKVNTTWVNIFICKISRTLSLRVSIVKLLWRAYSPLVSCFPGVQTPYPSRSHYSVLSLVGVHASLPILPIWSLLTRFLWWAASTKHTTAQRPRIAITLQFQPHRFRDFLFLSWSVASNELQWHLTFTHCHHLVNVISFLVSRVVNSAPAEFNPHSSSCSPLHICFLPWWDTTINASHTL